MPLVWLYLNSEVSGLSCVHRSDPLNILTGAKLIKAIPEIGSGWQAIEAYLQNYLYLLQSAGHHVLFSLPNFDDAGLRPYLDFSQIAYRLLDVEDVHGVAIEQINKYLSASWLSTLILANKQSVDHSVVSLAEYRSTWAPQDVHVHFHLNFGAPHVSALCDDEILMHFVLDDVRFYETADFEDECVIRYLSLPAN